MGERLGHVYWIGGGSGAGKSTIARHLADRYGLRLYDTDAAMTEHADRSRGSAYLESFAAMDMDERWVNREPRVMLETFHWYRGEGFAAIVEDLAAMAEPVVAEGFRLLPELVARRAAPGRAVWLLPTDRFRAEVFARRGWPATGFVARTSAPERALSNLLARDALFTERLREQTARLGLPAIEIDGSMGEERTVERIAARFGLEGSAARRPDAGAVKPGESASPDRPPGG